MGRASPSRTAEDAMLHPLYGRYEAHLAALRLERGPMGSNYEEALARMCEEERRRCVAELRALRDEERRLETSAHARGDADSAAIHDHFASAYDGAADHLEGLKDQ